MITVLAALAVGHNLVVQTPVYNPTGPRIVVTLEGKRSFTIATDPKSSPKTVAHILGLVRKRFYDGQRFHRVVPGFVIQWGAPASRDKDLSSEEVGSGGSGKKDLPFEESKVSFLKGVVGVASEGKKKGGDSQLFVMIGDATRLDGNYAVVGKVIQGQDVCDRVKVGDRILSMRVVESRVRK